MGLLCRTSVLSLYLIFIYIRIITAEVVMTIRNPVIETLTNANITLECNIVALDADIPLDQVTWANPRGVVLSLISTGPFGEEGHRRYLADVGGNNYNLKIMLVQPADDGTYSCVFNGVYPPLVKRLRVQVFVKPEKPMIVGLDSVVVDPISVGQEVERVTIPYGLTSAKIKCTVGPSKPAIPIKWFIGTEEITSNIEHREPVVASDNLETMTSILTVEISPPRYRLNEAVYRCVADLASVNLSAVRNLPPLERKFNLSAQYPPGDPIIEGFHENTVKKPGDVERLTCQTVGGNPLPTLQWFRNDEPYIHEFRTLESSTTVTSTVDIRIQPSDNNAVYRCDAKNPAIATPKSTSVTFRVNFPPTEVMITGNDPVKVGDSIVLSCTTTNSNPAARIIWRTRGRRLNTTNEDTTVTSSDNGGFITQTNLTVTPQRSDHLAGYTCQTSSELVTNTVSLDVLYSPDLVVIRGHNSSTAAMVDTSLKLTCSSHDGNPLPDLTWYKGSTRVTSGVGDLLTLGTTRSQELSFVAKPKHNGVMFKCAATSTASSTAIEAFINVSVHFPPLNVTITPLQPVKEDVEITLECDSGSSNPASTITWNKNETDVLSSVQNRGQRDAEFGGKATVNSYTFIPRASDNGVVIHCTARNELIRRSTTQGISLIVLHKPIFSGVPQILKLLEGKNISGDFSAIANPAIVTYTWFKVDGGVETQLTFVVKRDGAPAELSVVDGVIYLTNINRDKAGTYRVKGTNSEGTRAADFQINVLYAPAIPNSPTQSYEDNSLKLHCTVDANPPITETQARWTRINYDMSRATPTVTGSGTSRTFTLTISDVVRADIGVFTCEVNNTLGSATKEYTVTPVAFAPVIDRAPVTSKSAAQTHNDGLIKCILEAFPEPSITWSKAGSDIVLDGDKYSMATNLQGQIKFSFELTIKGIVESDYGTYLCTATNEKGSESHGIILSGTSKPDPPTNLQVLNASDSSVTLTWERGFDGGLQQTFNIRYHIPAITTTGYKYADASTIPYTITGLEPETEYAFTVQAFNNLGRSKYASPSISASTGVAPTAKSIILKPDEPMFIVIMALAVVGGLFLIVTTVLVCVFVRRRRKQKSSEATDSASQSNTEMYSTHNGSNFHDDAKSYSTYDKALDDDFAKHYENDNDINLAKTAITSKTHVTRQPWAKTEDPDGNYGVYIKQQQSIMSETSDNELFARELRDLTKSMHPQPEAYQRPAFAANRPPAPPPPGGKLHHLPPLPERNYSPNLNYLPPVQGGMQYHHASFGRSTPSVESTDDMRGHLV